MKVTEMTIKAYRRKTSGFCDDCEKEMLPGEDMFVVNTFYSGGYIDKNHFCEECAIEYIKKTGVKVKVV